ncbi:hypothetical protein PR048_012627 [Dryococelus australis]|uniref:Uncharacterized protein n=1 Tax=Dryococelus australis TaxID=614101 RepID=A0ABQ9HQR5_9NEOP|nr:hypothetical protein PR048_012627 [Dryococelus australis]
MILYERRAGEQPPPQRKNNGQYTNRGILPGWRPFHPGEWRETMLSSDIPKPHFGYHEKEEDIYNIVHSHISIYYPVLCGYEIESNDSGCIEYVEASVRRYRSVSCKVAKLFTIQYTCFHNKYAADYDTHTFPCYATSQRTEKMFVHHREFCPPHPRVTFEPTFGHLALSIRRSTERPPNFAKSTLCPAFARAVADMRITSRRPFRSDYSSSTSVNQVRFPAEFHIWETYDECCHLLVGFPDHCIPPLLHLTSYAALALTVTVQWSDYSSPTKANRVRFPTLDRPDFHTWITWRTYPIGLWVLCYFSGYSLFPLLLYLRRSRVAFSGALYSIVTTFRLSEKLCICNDHCQGHNYELLIMIILARLTPTAGVGVASKTLTSPGMCLIGKHTSTRMVGCRNEGAGEMGDPQESCRPTASSGTIPTCENPVTRPAIETGSPWWEASVLIAQPQRPHEQLNERFSQTLPRIPYTRNNHSPAHNVDYYYADVGEVYEIMVGTRHGLSVVCHRHQHAADITSLGTWPGDVPDSPL